MLRKFHSIPVEGDHMHRITNRMRGNPCRQRPRSKSHMHGRAWLDGLAASVVLSVFFSGIEGRHSAAQQQF